MLRNSLLALLFAAPGLAGCGNPMHLSYDYGRAYNAAYSQQPDLTRPSVAAVQHPLNGLEATDIRLNVREESTDEETEESEHTIGMGGGS